MVDTILRREALKRKQQKEKPKLNYYDNMDFICEKFMFHLRKDFRGHKAEITPHQLTKKTKKFALAYGLKESELLQALLIRGWLEPNAADIYLIRYDLVRK